MPLISVIIPIYNVERYLNRCIESVLNQTFINFELILIDDGSPDDCGLICDKYAIADERVVVIHKKNGGVSSARNAALNIVSGEYITFCDSDDYWKEDWLESLVDSITKNEADMAIGSYIAVSDEGNVIKKEKQEIGVYDLNNQEERLQYNIDKIFGYKHGWEIWKRIYKMDIIRKHRIRFCESCGNFAEDLIFVLEYSLHAKKINSIECDSYRYCIRTGSMMDKSKNTIKLNELNEASKYLFDKTQKLTETKKYFPIYHFLIMYNQYVRVLYTEKYKDISREINKIEDMNYWKKQTKAIYKCRKKMSMLWGKYHTYRIFLLSHYCLHQNWKRFKIESAIFYKMASIWKKD